MSMPGFNAEASAYKTNRHYRLASGNRSKSFSHVGLAQFELISPPASLAGEDPGFIYKACYAAVYLGCSILGNPHEYCHTLADDTCEDFKKKTPPIMA